MQRVVMFAMLKRTKGQMHLLSKQKDQRICPCMFHMFIFINS